MLPEPPNPTKDFIDKILKEYEQKEEDDGQLST
jgi:hypothetical protein